MFAVIGAGVAGLQAAAQLKQAGFDVTLFEKSGNVGGVWQSNYAGYGLQVRKWHYEIPGYAWPDSESHPRYPTGPEVQAYLESYARDAGLVPLIRFRVEVQALRPAAAAAGAAAAPGTGVGKGGEQPKLEGASGWEVDWTDDTGAAHKDAFDYVVVATGLFNEPVHPEWAEGLIRSQPSEAGSGAGPWVVDAKNFTDASVAQGKRVVVVGAGKTAHDVGVTVSKLAASTTLVARRGHWMAPQLVLGFIPFEFASYTRWAWSLQPAWYAAGPVRKAAHKLAYPVKAAAWALFGAIFPLQTGTPGKLVPRHGLLEGVYDTVGMVDSKKVRTAFKSGQLATRLASVESVSGDKLLLSDGSELEADIVVLATGYLATARTLFPDQALQERAGYQGGNQWLYRNVLPPGLANLAFIGQNATFQHVLTTALQSRWLVDVVSGVIQLPPQTEKLADIAAQQEWLKRFGGVHRTNNSVWAQHGKYHDALVKDIRGSTAAYARWNLLAEWFGYIYNQLYAPLFPGNSLLRADALALANSKGGGAAAAGVAHGAVGPAVANGKAAGAGKVANGKTGSGKAASLAGVSITAVEGQGAGLTAAAAS